MSSAMKRLSTIIRPGHSKDKSAVSADEPSTDSKPQDTNGTTEPKPTEQPVTSTDLPKENPIDGVQPEPAVDAPPVSTTTDAPPAPAVATNGETERPAAEDPAVHADPAAAASAPKEEKTDATVPSSYKKERSARDIGRDTIRRFSSILRAQGRDGSSKEHVPSVPKSDAAPAIDAPAAPVTIESATETPATDVPPVEGTMSATPAPAPAPTPAPETPQVVPTTPSKTKKEKEKKEKDKPATPTGEAGKTAKRRSSFFQGLQRTKTPSKPKEVKEKAKAEVVPKLVKKGAARGKRVVVVTGASRTAGLEFVKQLAIQPDTFVIALSRSADKAPELKSLVIASAKRDHNVRALRLDATSPKSVASTVKEIVELTDGRIDILINATETRADPTVKMWDIKGAELEEELQSNLVGPIAITNALIPYLKPFEKKKQEAAKTSEGETPKSAEEPKEDEAAATAPVEPGPAADIATEEPVATSAAAAPAEKAVTEFALEANADATAKATDGLAETAAGAEAGANPEEPAASAAVAEAQSDPITETETETEPFLPSVPFILFLSPADTIANQNGAVPTGHTFAPAPRNLFTISRAALQVAIAKYALGLGSKGVGIVGIERAGLNDPHANISEEVAVKGVLKLLPGLTVLDNGKLLRSSA